MNERVLLTGSDGFIGRQLTKELQMHGVEVLTMPRGWDVSQSCAFTDLRDETVTAVIHLAALCSVPESWKRPADYYRVNLMGTLYALEFCRKCGARFILPSSYMYGAPQYLPVDEEHPLAVNNPYAQSKHFAEQASSFYAFNFQIPVTVLRLFNVYGPGQRSDFLIPNVVRQVIWGKKIVLQSLTPRRDFVHVRDVSRAFLLAVEQPMDYLCLNVGSGVSYSVEDLTELAQAVAKAQKPVENKGERRKNEIDEVVADCRKIEKTLGWKAEISLREGLSELVEMEKLKYEQTIYAD